MKKSLVPIVILLMIIGYTLPAWSQSSTNEARLLRFPNAAKDKIAFVYAGDIYTVPRTGGQATRLTGHEGLELFPRFSPDGSMIAFTGQYDGDMAVYVMPAGGGEPRRLTYHPGILHTSERFGPDNIVMGWSNDGTKVLYRSRKEAMSWWEGRAFLVNVNGGISEPLPMKSAGFTCFSPDGKKVAYCPIYRDFRTWKRYKGGMAQDVWIFDLSNYNSEKITDWVGTDNLPMWYGDKIYFNSDRTSKTDSAGTLNLYCYDTKTGQIRQVTSFTDYDVRWPSLGTDAVAFEKGGYLYLMDLPSEQVHKITVDLITDRHTVRPEIVEASNRLYDFDISPDAKRAVFSGRGDIFTIPAKNGNTRNLTNLTGSKEVVPRWSPDGKWICFNSDSTGEEELYLVSQDGKEKIRLTTDGHCRKFEPQWSPDSKKLVFSDRDQNIYCLDIATKKQTKIDYAPRDRVRNFSWSSDSKYLAYDKEGANRIQAVYVYSFIDNTVHQVTPGFTNDFSPAFDPDGKYLYFLSQRNFNPILSTYEFTSVNNAITNLYLIVLSANEKSPFAPKSDEVTVTENKEAKPETAPSKDKGGKPEEKKAAETKIDFDGIFNRQVAIDLPSGQYYGLAAVSGAVFYISGPLRGLRGTIGRDERALHKYVIEDKKDNVFAEGVDNFTFTPDGKKALLKKGNDYFICETGGKKADFEDNRLDLSGMQMLVDHTAEYRQMYDEVWRMERDFFYDEHMNGVDWKKIHDKYAVLLPYVINRYDFTYTIGEMLGDLCNSHTYVGGGESPRIAPTNTGLLGADFELDKSANRIRIARLLQGEDWDEELRSPLTEPGLNVKPGDYLLAIDGHQLTGDHDPYMLTGNTVGKTITLTVNSRPSNDGARDIVVRPTPSEELLRYYDWVETNRRYVDSVSGGKIGYIHIPDMDSFGLVRFMKMFYNQMRRDGLIIDVRYNGGGFVSDLILQRLRDPLTSMGAGRDSVVTPNGLKAYMLTLCNEFSCSDGDIFPYFFREYKLGPLMGKRTWGGVVGISGFAPLLDGGYYTVPEGAFYNLKGQWAVENIGVEPDIVVDNPPDRLVRGHDDQLDRAIEYLQKEIKDHPIILPPRPAPPTPR